MRSHINPSNAAAAEAQAGLDAEPLLTADDALSGPTNGGWNFYALKSLVSSRAAEFPGAADEWRAYIDNLQPYADVGGYLPPRFNELVAEVFSPLV